MVRKVNMATSARPTLEQFLKDNPDAIKVAPMDKNIGDRIFMAEGTPSCSGETSYASIETLGNEPASKEDQ